MALTNIQRQVLDGCLLGDGCLQIQKKGKNAYFQYNSSVKNHVKTVHKHFKIFCTNNYQKVKRGEYLDKRTNKTYVRYYFKTKCLSIFTKEKKRWYKIYKIVPENVKITNISILFWYLGDGELEIKNGYIKLHTNSFTKEENLKLCAKIGFSSKLQKKKENVYLIIIPHRRVKEFLSYIGKCPVKKYAHKWKEVPYKNKNIEKNGIKYHYKKYPKIIKDWLTNNFTLYYLSKKYDVDVTAITNHFDKNNIKWKPKINKKAIQQLDSRNNFINDWESGQEIKRRLNYNASAISECCRGIRKTYKGFIWKFKN